jgi:hypothetical protein
MNAGTELQMMYANYFVKHYRNNKYDYSEICQMLKQHSLLIDKETNPELNVGYRYGSAWLIMLIPPSVIDWIKQLPSSDPTSIRPAILDYLLEHNYKWLITPADQNPNMMNESIKMDHWKVIFKNSDGNQFITYFSTGLGHRLYPTNEQSSLNIIAMNWVKKTIKMFGHIDKIDKWRTSIKELGLYVESVPLASLSNRSIYEGIRKSPMPNEVIECLCSDWLSIENYNDWNDWATDMGYDLNNKSDRRKARRSFEAIEDQSADAQIFFGSDWSKLIDLTY